MSVTLKYKTATNWDRVTEFDSEKDKQTFIKDRGLIRTQTLQIEYSEYNAREFFVMDTYAVPEYSLTSHLKEALRNAKFTFETAKQNRDAQVKAVDSALLELEKLEKLSAKL